MDILSVREREIFDTLRSLEGEQFLLIGGYAVNAYTLPRFSVDCDIVIKDRYGLGRIERILSGRSYKEIKTRSDLPYHGEFIRYEKEVRPGFRASMDILVGTVSDRQSGASFPWSYLAENSRRMRLNAKTFPDALEALVPDAETLLIMKFASCRGTDIRDIFMLIVHIEDLKGLRRAIRKQGIDFKKSYDRIRELVTSKEFKKNLEGVYGYVDESAFDKHRKLILRLGMD